MRKYLIDNMTNGWFIGPFEPSCFKTEMFECALKKYKQRENPSLRTSS